MSLIKSLLKDSVVEMMYIMAGRDFGLADMDLPIGKDVRFESLLKKWADWEKEYANRGYETRSLDEFKLSYGGTRPITIGKKVEHGKKPVLYAEEYINSRKLFQNNQS